VAASLVDFGLFFFHNAQALAKGGKGPFFYLPKLEHYLEARLWNDIFIYSEEALGLKRGTTKATILIETLPAAFQMDEILYELREHSAGLNCGRWDYIFSYIKTMRAHAAYTLPDRGQVGMTQPCMRAYSQLAIQTCHRRGAHAMGGMAAQIPIKNDPVANEQALAKVRADKEREVTDGHDGTWVAHPGLVPLALEIFDAHMDGAHQIERQLDDLNVSASDLLEVPTGTRTEAGLRQNVNVGIQYLESWLRGSGCVPLYNLMEDAATAEISRTQIWQWIHHEATLEDGRPITANLLEQIITDELGKIQNSIGVEGYQAGRFEQANRLFKALCTSESLQSFLTLPAYEMITNLHSPR
jgi:malate synthase